MPMSTYPITNWDVFTRKRYFISFKKKIRDALIDQVEDFVNQSGFFPYSRLELGKAYGSKETTEEVIEEVQKELEALTFFLGVDDFFNALVSASNDGGKNYLAKVGIQGVFRLKNEALIQRLRERQDLMIGKINPITGNLMGRGLLDSTTIDYISGVITRGVIEGKSNFEVADELLKNNRIISQNRAEMIANAEVSNAINNMELEAAIRNGSQFKHWDTSHDNRVTEQCRHNQAQGDVPILEPFESGHQSPPRFPRCRCILEFSRPDRGDNFWFGD